MSARLAGRTAIVTGAASGIGRAIAARLAQDGARIVVADLRRSDSGDLNVQADVSDEADVARVVSETMNAFGRIDILVNNAALFSALVPRGFEQLDAAEWRKVMDVNTLGVFLCARACAPHMRARRYGRIINLASGAPLKGVPFLLHYVASKGAVIAMTRALARELGADGITVNALAPGFTLSEGVKASAAHLKHGAAIAATRAIARDEKPEDLVGAVSFLASEDAAFVTGQTLVVDGGSAMV